jgi:monofunctional biosynthetic peptidoglycan transglycosylase
MNRSDAASQRVTMTGMVLLTITISYGGTVESGLSDNMIERGGSRSGWYVVNDGVMGGISQSQATFTQQKTLLFSGLVSLENNGGFASIRHDTQGTCIGYGYGIRLRVKGDGKTYQLRVRTSDRFDGIAYKADFDTVKDQWQELRIPWEEFQATYRGRFISDAPDLKGDQIRQVGFLIAGRQEGPFELEVEFLGSMENKE